MVCLDPQHVDTGEVLMQAFADRAAISETMQAIPPTTGPLPSFRRTALMAPVLRAAASPAASEATHHH